MAQSSRVKPSKTNAATACLALVLVPVAAVLIMQLYSSSYSSRDQQATEEHAALLVDEQDGDECNCATEVQKLQTMSSRSVICLALMLSNSGANILC